MPVKSDRWIKEMARKHKIHTDMISGSPMNSRFSPTPTRL